jgi:hypothetical protein
VREENLMGPFMSLSVCRVFLGIRQPAWHLWNTLLQQWGLRSLLENNNDLGSHRHNDLWHQLPFISLLHLLFPSRKSDVSPHLLWALDINWATCWHHCLWCGVQDTWNSGVLQRVYLSSLVCAFKYTSCCSEQRNLGEEACRLLSAYTVSWRQ